MSNFCVSNANLYLLVPVPLMAEETKLAGLGCPVPTKFTNAVITATSRLADICAREVWRHAISIVESHRKIAETAKMWSNRDGAVAFAGQIRCSLVHFKEQALS